MSLNYKVIKEGKDFHIKETSTNEVILILDSKEKAQKIATHLNMGGGFDGFTPKFFLNETLYK